MDESQDDINTESLGSKENKWVKILKELKEKQINTSSDPNIPVTVYVGRNDKYITASIALSEKITEPKYQGLQAASILRAAIDPDLIVFIFDGYCTDDQSLRDLSEEFNKGNLRVKESLTCISINRYKELSMIILPYYYGGGNIIIWEETEIMGPGEGFIASNLMKIICESPLIDSPLLQAIELDKERQIYLATRAAVKFLRDKGFTVTGDV